MTTRLRVSPINRDGVLTAFQKLLAPRPLVYVFRALPGWQYAATEIPGTYQVVLGVSAELWRYIEWRIFNDTGRPVRAQVDVYHVHEGNCLNIELWQPPNVMPVPEPGPEAWEPLPTLKLMPKPIASPSED